MHGPHLYLPLHFAIFLYIEILLPIKYFCFVDKFIFQILFFQMVFEFYKVQLEKFFLTRRQKLLVNYETTFGISHTYISLNVPQKLYVSKVLLISAWQYGIMGNGN